ncbi:glycoside hydrolase family 99-like domain-containing protein [Flavobacterium sp. RS13.1]|uniref:glycosyltransferase WbsX family protein n=1 Tax=Flavobacterium sp. RS13.1 TaxID=3400345 RepID=UPI003AAA793C
METKARVIAFYLPQFHPIPENDIWWGKGFTEWTNVGKAKQFFKGHYQPRVPADLGYYDLRVPETRKAQADMAREHGIEGFCYWHYWFGNGKRLLERPFNEVLALGEPDFPFCLAWANETWKGFSHGLKNRNVLIEQLYPGEADYTAHFYEVLPAFKDTRYITVDGKPLFFIYQPLSFSEIKVFIALWRKLALENGLEGIYFVSNFDDYNKFKEIISLGFDAVNINRLFAYKKKRLVLLSKLKRYSKRLLLKIPNVFQYSEVYPSFTNIEDENNGVFPTIIPGWDHTPRSGKEGLVYHNSTPELFELHVKEVLERVKHKSSNKNIVFLKSWNEWAEGNYMEPDLKWGTKYLEVLKRQIVK